MFFLNCLVTSQRSSSNHNMPAGEVTESAYNYDNKWCKSGVRGSQRDMVLLHAMSAVGVWRYKINRLTLQLGSLPFSRSGIFQALSTFRTNILQDLITKWSVPTLCWLLLFMGTWVEGGLRDTETTLQLRLRWMLVYTYSPGKVRGFLVSTAGVCVRGERLHSVYIIKARHTRRHTLTQAFKNRARFYLAPSLYFLPCFSKWHTHSCIILSQKSPAVTLFATQWKSNSS